MFMKYSCLLIFVATGVSCIRESTPIATKTRMDESPSANVSTANEQPQPAQDIRPVVDRELAAQQRLDQLDAELKERVENLKQQVRSTDSKEEQLRLLSDASPARQMSTEYLSLETQFAHSTAARDALLFVIANGSPADKEIATTRLLSNYNDLIQSNKIVDSFQDEIPRSIIDQWFQVLIANANTESDAAYAAIGWAKYTRQIPVFKETLDLNPSVVARLSAEQVAYISRPRTEAERAAIAAALEQAMAKSDDLASDSDKAIRDTASTELFELRNLYVGQVAPDMEGMDLDGVKFRLSDYRGKVIMLDFWGHWCPPCRALYDHERFINRTLADKPFVILGINSDPKLETAQKAVRKETLSWRHFWNGTAGTGGPLSSAWNIEGWPTIYLIDQYGVIRYKGSSAESIDNGLKILLAEMGHDVDLSEQITSNSAVD